jgi:hypothetical protein
MFVYVKYKNIPKNPITEKDSHYLVQSKQARVLNKSPFTIEVFVDYIDRSEIIMYVNIKLTKIEIIVSSKEGTIFMVNSLKVDELNKLQGIFVFIKTFIKIDHIYIQINKDTVASYSGKYYYFKDFQKSLFNLTGSINYCDVCGIHTESFTIKKFIKDYSFSGNGLLLCDKCLNKESDKKLIAEKNANKLFNNYKKILDVLKNIFKEK